MLRLPHRASFLPSFSPILLILGFIALLVLFPTSADAASLLDTGGASASGAKSSPTRVANSSASIPTPLPSLTPSPTATSAVSPIDVPPSLPPDAPAIPTPANLLSGPSALVATSGGTSVCGTISANTTWAPAGNPYTVTCNVTVNKGVVLTISPGTIVLFNQGTGLTVNGVLKAPGTASSRITFTANTSTPTRGYWTAITANAGGVAILVYAMASYGGGSSGGTIVANGGTVVLAADTISNSNADGVKSTSGSLVYVLYSILASNSGDGIDLVSAKSAVLESNKILGNGSFGVYLSDPVALTLTKNAFIGNANDAAYWQFNDTGVASPLISGNTATKNAINGIGIAGSLNTTNLPSAGIAYVLNGVTINAGNTVTFGAGSVAKFESGSSLTVNGSLIASRTATSPAFFTSFKDDSVGGDTNGDGNASSPAPGDWHYIQVNAGGSASLTDTTVTYGGFGVAGCCPSYYGEIFLNGGSLALNGSTITNSAYDGIDGSGTLTATGSSITNNAASGINLSFTSGSIVNGNVDSNASYGVYNSNTATTVQTTNVWWGGNDGPAPYGSENGVNPPYVNAAPWGVTFSNTPTPGPTPTPIPTDTPYPQPTSTTEDTFRANLQGTITTYPTQTPQYIKNFLLDPDGYVELYEGLYGVLSPMCQDLFVEAASNADLQTICAGQAIAGQQFVNGVLTNFAASLIGGSIDPLFDTYSYGGQAIVAVAQTLTQYSMSNCSQSGGLSGDLLDQLVLSVAQAESAELVNQYLGDSNWYNWSLSQAKQDLGLDNATSNCATQTVTTIPNTGSSMRVHGTVSYLYNPFTHMMTVYLSSDQAPGIQYLVIYQVNGSGSLVPGTSATMTTLNASGFLPTRPRVTRRVFYLKSSAAHPPPLAPHLPLQRTGRTETLEAD